MYYAIPFQKLGEGQLSDTSQASKVQFVVQHHLVNLKLYLLYFAMTNVN